MPSLGLWCKIAISLSETHLAKSVLSFHETTSSFNLPRSLVQVHRCKEHRIAIYFHHRRITSSIFFKSVSLWESRLYLRTSKPQSTTKSKAPKYKRYTEGKRTPQLIGHWCNLLYSQKDNVMKKSIVEVNVVKMKWKKVCYSIYEAPSMWINRCQPALLYSATRGK